MTTTDLKSGDLKKKDDKKDEPKELVAKVWNESEVNLLKKWGETAASYRLLHDRAFRANSATAYRYTIPIIVLSTITGTASFSQTLFPPKYQPYVPMVIGGINIFVGILSTVSRFFRIDELTEAHRVASISYGKFARNIATELSLPPMNRKYNGADLVEMCRTEMDRLIEQSPVIDMDILRDFQKNPLFEKIQKPEVLVINPIEEYKLSKEEKVAEIVSHVVERLKQAKPEKTLVQQMADRHGGGGPLPPHSPPLYVHPTLPPHINSTGSQRDPRELQRSLDGIAKVPTIEEAQRTMRQLELADMAGKNLVSGAKAKFIGLAGKAIKKQETEVDIEMGDSLKGALQKKITENDMIQRLEEMAQEGGEKKKKLDDISEKIVTEAQQANISDLLLDHDTTK